MSAPMSSGVSTSILNLLPVSIPRVTGLEKPTSWASNLLPLSSAGAEALVLLALMYWTTVAFLSFRPAKLTSLLIIAAISLAT